MRNSELVRPQCEECDQRFASDDEAKKHFHLINKLHEEPLTYLLLLPPNCSPGTMEAVTAFTKAFEELKAKHKDQGVRFQLVPLGYIHSNQGNQTYAALDSMLAVAM